MAFELPLLPPDLALPLWNRVLEAVSGPTSQRLGLGAARSAIAIRGVFPGRRIERAVMKWMVEEGTCCACGSPFLAFLQRYLPLFESSGSTGRMRRYLARAKPDAAARRLESWVRVAAISNLRHEVLAPFTGKPGVPPHLLTSAQIAMAPVCDLTCTGCYTVEDRGGKAPRREDIAFYIDEAAACGAFMMHLIGKGEPLLSPRFRDELLDVIEGRPHLFFTLATHGMHIDDALAARLGRLPNLVLLVAIEGPEAVHDARRGAGSFRVVSESLERLRAHDALFGFSCMVSAKSREHIVKPEFVQARVDEGCVTGVYTRYFPLAGGGETDLTLTRADLRAYSPAFAKLQASASIPLLDLDEVEEHAGCHSRSGDTVYIDGITGQVSPCVRVPFSPPDCRISREEGLHLSAALGHPFFTAYRRTPGACKPWCGADLGRELSAVNSLLKEHAPIPARLDRYQGRAAATARLPVIEAEVGS